MYSTYLWHSVFESLVECSEGEEDDVGDGDDGDDGGDGRDLARYLAEADFDIHSAAAIDDAFPFQTNDAY